MRNLVGATIPNALAEEAHTVIEDIRAGRLKSRDSGRVVEVVSKMTEVVMHHFFVRPTENIGVGGTLRGMIQFGANSAAKTIHYGLKKMIPKLKDAQLMQLADFLDQSLFDPGALSK